MSTPSFLTMSPEQISEFRNCDEVKIMMEWLAWERERCREQMLQETIKGNTAMAAIRAGSTLCFDHVLRALDTPFAIAEVPEEDYKDPARRPSRKG